MSIQDFEVCDIFCFQTVKFADMGKDELLDSRVSVAQCKHAVDTLHSYATKKAEKEAENQLLPAKEPAVWLTVALKKQPKTTSIKPMKIPIVHPIVDPRTNGVCLLTKDPQRKYKDLLEDKGIKFISRVIGLEKLKGKFKPFEARRALLKENGLFLADESIIPLLPKLLGSKWIEAKKQPIPVCLTRKDLKGELERAISSTYMSSIRGTAVSIKIGTLSQTPAQIFANLKTALPAVAARVNGGWDNVQRFGIKTNTSVDLPIWTCSLDDKEGGRWAGLTAVEDEDEDVEMDADEEGEEDEEEDEAEEEESVSEEMEVEVPKAASKAGAKGTAQEKGKKRLAVDDGEEEKEKPKKKAKSSAAATKPASELKVPSTEVSAKSKKSKSSTSETPSAPAPVPATAPSTDETSSKPNKRRKSKASEDVQSMDTVPVTPAAPSAAPAKSEKSKKKGTPSELSQSSASMEIDSVTTSAPTTSTPATAPIPKLKKKKSQAAGLAESASASTPAPVVDATTAAPAPTPALKKKKSQASGLSESSSASAPAPVATPATTAGNATPKAGLKKKKSRAEGLAAVEASADADTSIVVAAEKVVEAVAEKPKKKSRPSEVVVDSGAIEPAPTPADDVVAPEPSSSKKSKKKARASEVAASDPAPVIPVAEKVTESPSAETVAATPKSQKKQKKKHVLDAPSAVEPVQESTPVVEKTPDAVPKKKKEKSLAVAEAEEFIADALGGKSIALSTPTEGEPKKKKKEKKDKEGKDMDVAPSTTPDTAPSEISSKEKTKKTKKSKVAEEVQAADNDAVPAQPVPSSKLSKDELKQKRSSGAGEKKKEKVVKARGGKSVKDGLLGKKTA